MRIKMSSKIKYTKSNGEESKRKIILLNTPRDNYLAYDVSNLEDKDINNLEECLQLVNLFREKILTEFEKETGIQVNTLFRSFKTEGITWLK